MCQPPDTRDGRKRRCLRVPEALRECFEVAPFRFRAKAAQVERDTEQALLCPIVQVTLQTRPPHRELSQVLSLVYQPLPPVVKTKHPARVETASEAFEFQAAVAPGAPAVNVLREGTFLVDRTGRLTRGADAQSWEFAFEADGKTMKDPPVVILPNLKLMAMVDAIKNANRDLKFKITGMVTEYNGRNYVLLEKVLVVPDTQRL